MNRSGIVERYIVFKTSGSIKERTETHRNGHQLSTKWALGTRPRPDRWLGTARVCRKWPCI